jgi:hypothetical protein
MKKMKKCPSCGTESKTVASSPPSRNRTGEMRAAVAASPRQGVPTAKEKSGFHNVNICGESAKLNEQMKAYSMVNRVDTPKQLISGGPDVMNKGEHIFTVYPRRTDQGRTIRSNQES